MKLRVTILVFLICLAAAPVMAASEKYLGGDILLGGSGVTVTRVTTTATPRPITTVPTPTLPQTGSLSVTTTPAGAVVFIDNVRMGTSPATFPDLAQGGHTLRITLEGYTDIMAPVAITAGETKEYTVTMVPVGTPLPAHPTTKAPGFGPVAGIACLGGVLAIRKIIS